MALVDYAGQLPSYIAGLAETVVGGGYAQFQTFAVDALTLAHSATNALSTIRYEPVSTAVQFYPPGAPGVFVPPTKPTDKVAAYKAPPEPPLIAIKPVVMMDTAGPAPRNPINSSFHYNVPADKPGPLLADPPPPMGPLDPVVVKDMPYLPPVPVPNFFPITIPEPPVIKDITFEGELPPRDFEVPAMSFAFEETLYTSELLDATRAKLKEMIQGNYLGLPPNIEAALYNRACAREADTAFAARQVVYEEFTSRGFSEPDGIIAKRLLEVTQNDQNQRNEHSRNTEVENTKLMVESLHKAIAESIACETVLINAHMAIMERRFMAAKFTYEAAMGIFNAMIALYTTDMEAFKVYAQVYRDMIAAETLKIEQYKTQIEAQALIGEVNKTLVQQYNGMVAARGQYIEQYNAEVNAAKVRAEINVSKIEAQRLLVQTFGELVKAWGFEWEGYKTAVEAERGKIEAAEIAARIYATDVQAWGMVRQADAERARIDLAIEELHLRKFDTDIKKYVALLENANQQVQASVQALQAHTQVYAAGGQIATAASAASDRSFQLTLDRASKDADIKLAQINANIQQAVASSSQMIEIHKGISQVCAQLAASAMSAVNISGSVGVQASASMAYSNSVSYNLSEAVE